MYFFSRFKIFRIKKLKSGLKLHERGVILPEIFSGIQYPDESSA